MRRGVSRVERGVFVRVCVYLLINDKYTSESDESDVHRAGRALSALHCSVHSAPFCSRWSRFGVTTSRSCILPSLCKSTGSPGLLGTLIVTTS